jgi:pimeloyl-ACP methyl ester carboxylesterase
MGGWTCLRFAVDNPGRVNRLLMADTHGGITTPEVIAAARAPRDERGLPEGVHPAAGARMHTEQPDLYFLYTQIDALNTPRDRQQLGALIRSCGTVSADEAARLDIPVLFIAGAEDVVIPPAMLQVACTLFRAGRFQMVPDAGHSVYFERAEQFNALLESFLGPS